MRVSIRLPASPTRETDGRFTARGFLERAARADGYGFDRISVGDTQLNNMECFTAIGLLAAHTTNAMIGPGVTNVVTRDVGVLANTLASLDVVSGGRMFCLLARGDGAVRNAGLRPARVDELRKYYCALRDLLADGYARFGEREVRLPWAGKMSRQVPLYLVAEGPRMLRLAGEIADGVFVGAGLVPEVVAQVRATIAEGAADAGRDQSAIDVWWDTRSGIAPTHADALERARESVASMGNHSFRSDLEGKLVPPELHAPIREFQRRFDYAEKGTSAQNGPLMDELGLTAYFTERFGVVGTPEEVVERLRYLESIGVDQVSMASHDRGLKGVPDSIDLIGREVLPHVRAEVDVRP